MNYRVLLVDDEALIREAISENVPWNELGFELMGTCENGRDAMRIMKQDPPDLLLTDIYMPFVDGMELARYAYEECPDTRVIIISGYDEFEYAKKAVKYQVMEYIVKPITAAELLGVLRRAKEELDEKYVKFQNIKKLRGAYVSNLPLLRGRFLNGLLKGTARIDNLQDKCAELSIQLNGPWFNTALVEGEDLTPFLSQYPDVQEELAYFAIYNITQELVEEQKLGVVFQDPEEQTVIIFSGESEKELNGRISAICDVIHQAVLEYGQIETSISVGVTVRDVEHLSRSYEKTLGIREHKFLLGGGQVLKAWDFPEERMRRSQVLDVGSWAGRTVRAIKNGSEKEIRDSVLDFAQEIRESYVTRNRSILYVQNFMLTILNKMTLPEEAEEMVLDKERTIINQIYTYGHLSEMAKDVQELCLLLARQLSDQKNTMAQKQARLALEYIDEHYGESQVSLNAVCSHLAVSTSYFSALFKAYTGETFIEALTEKRMEEAKKLLENTALRTYEIAEQVGYSDSHYFSLAFKKYTGKTPTEYAKEKR